MKTFQNFPKSDISFFYRLLLNQLIIRWRMLVSRVVLLLQQPLQPHSLLLHMVVQQQSHQVCYLFSSDMEFDLMKL